MSDTPTLRRFIEALISNDVSGGLLWGLRPHRGDGGFYYHNESGTVYNSYHWPGFAAGAGTMSRPCSPCYATAPFAFGAWRRRS